MRHGHAPQPSRRTPGTRYKPIDVGGVFVCRHLTGERAMRARCRPTLELRKGADTAQDWLIQ